MSKALAGEGEGRSPESRIGLFLALAVLALLPLVFYGSMILHGWEPSAPDTGASQPFGIWGTETTHLTGKVPLWYPYIFSGMPSYGSLMYTPRSPVNPVAFVQSLVRENRGAYYVFLLIVAGFANFAFLRRQGFTRLACATAALLYSLTPYIPGSVAAGHSTKLEALCLLPVLLLTLDLFFDRPDLLRCAALAAAGACLAWSNHPQVAFYGLFIGFLYGLGILLSEKRRSWMRRDWMRFALFLVLAVALSLAMVAEPYLAVREYTPYSIRGGGVAEGGTQAPGTGGVGWDYATTWSFHPVELISFLFPAWFGLEGAAYWGRMPFTSSTHYFGILALALALFALWKGVGKRRWIWAGISGAVLLLGFGRYVPVLYGPMYYLVPFFNKFRVPSMIYGVLPLCLGPLIACGLDRAVEKAQEWSRQVGAPSVAAPSKGSKGKSLSGKVGGGKGESRRPERVLLTVLAVLAICWILIAVVARSQIGNLAKPDEIRGMDGATLSAVTAEREALLQQSVAQGMLLCLAGVGLLLLASLAVWPRKRIAPWLGLALAMLSVGDVFLTGRHFYKVGPKEEVKKAIPLAGAASFVAQHPGTYRILPLDVQSRGVQMISSNAYGLVPLESVAGYQPAKLKAYQDLIEKSLLLRPGVLEMLNVHYILSSAPINLGLKPAYQGDGYVYALTDSLPRAWAVHLITKVADAAAMFRALGDDDFRPEDMALVYPAGAPPADRYASARVSLLERGIGKLRLRVEAEGTAFVVLSEIGFPPGWRAKVNGAPTRIYRVDHVLQGCEVPSGSSEVELFFTSPARERGVAVSRAAAGATLLIALAGIFLARRRSGASV